MCSSRVLQVRRSFDITQDYLSFPAPIIGTGKSVLLREIIRILKADHPEQYSVAITASTGIGRNLNPSNHLVLLNPCSGCQYWRRHPTFMGRDWLRPRACKKHGFQDTPPANLCTGPRTMERSKVLNNRREYVPE
jgi:hypothetical protein